MTLNNNKYLTNQYKINVSVLFFKKQIVAKQHIMYEKHSIYNVILITVYSIFFWNLSNIIFFYFKEHYTQNETGL